VFPAQQFVVQGDDQRAERKWPHEVPRDDVQALGLGPRLLLLQPRPQSLPIPEGQRTQRLLRVPGDVEPVGGEVEAGHEEAL